MKRIRYVSEFSGTTTAKQLSEITEKSIRNNERDGITGMLVASGGMFFQLIEGPDDAVNGLFARIERDERHRNVLLLDVETGENLKRVCPDWAMAKADLSSRSDVRIEPIKAIMRAICEQRKIIQDLSKTLERGMWRELIAAEESSLGS